MAESIPELYGVGSGSETIIAIGYSFPHRRQTYYHRPIAKPAYDRLTSREQTELRWGARAVVTGDAHGKRVFGRGIFSFEFSSDITVYVEDRPDEIRIVHIIWGR